MPDVYDKEKEETKYTPGQHDDLDVHPERREAEAAELDRQFNGSGAEEPDIKQAEEAGNSRDTPGRGEQSELGKLGGLYRDESGKKKGRSFFKGRRRQVLGGGILGGGIIGSLIYFGSFLTGPFEFVHLAQLMDQFHFSVHEDQSDIRTNRLIRYVRDPSKPQNVRLSYLGNKYADKFEARVSKTGVSSAYTKRLGFGEGYVVDRESRAFNNLTDDEVKQKLVKEYGVPEGAITTKNGAIRFDVGTGYLANAKMNRTLLKQANYSKINSWIGGRMLGKRAGVTWHPIRKIDDKLLKTADAKLKAWQERRATEINQGERAALAAADSQKDKNGKAVSSPDSTAAIEGANEIIDEGNSIAQGPDKSPGPVEQFRGHLATKIAGGGAAVVGIGCLAKEVGETAAAEKQAKVVLPLIRVGVSAMSTGGQIMAGEDIDMDQVKYIHDLMYGQDSRSTKNKPQTSSWIESESIQANLGKSGGVEPSDTLTSIGKGTPFDFLSQGTLGVALGGACSTAGTIIMGAFSIATGPLSFLAGAGASAVFLPKVIDSLANWLSGAPVNPFARGADFGNQVDFGTFLAGNDVAIGSGGTAQSSAETAYLQSISSGLDEEEFASQNFAYRTFSPYDQKSLVSQAMDGRNKDPGSVITSVATSLFNSPKTIASALKSPTQKAHAAGAKYNYGVPTYSFSQADMEDKSVQNPYANATRAAALLDGPDGGSFISKAKECFGVDIRKDSQNSWMVDPKTDSVEAYNQDYSNKNCGDQSANWRTIRMFIFDSETMDSMACFEGDDESCQNTGMSASTEAAGAGGSFRIASFNMRGASHTDGSSDPKDDYRNRMDKSVEAMHTNNLDIIGFQELQPKQYDLLKEKAGDTYELTKKGSNHLTENAIGWDKSKFTKTDEGIMPDLLYFDNSTLHDPYVKLKDNSSGQEFYVLNTHDPANANGCDCASERLHNANQHVKFINQLKSQGLPILFTGDFNSGYEKRPPGSNGSTVDNKDENLTYCVVTRNNTMHDSYDLFKQRPVTCPNPLEAGDRAGAANGIDHIFLTEGISVAKFFRIPVGYTNNGSDHPTAVADVVLPGGGSTSASADLVNGISWPVPKKFWNSNRNDFLDAHVMYSGTFTSPNTNGLASDISTPPDGTPVYSMLDGVVERTNLCGRGDGMMIKSTVPGGTLHIAYGHGTNPRFKEGDTVKAGQQILNLGALGCQVSGGHLHVDMALNTQHICPQDVFLAMGKGDAVDFKSLTSKAAAPCGRL